MRIASLLALILGSSLWLTAEPSRSWRYTDGRTLTAEYQWASRETLYLRDKKGKEFEVPLGALSNADLEYVRLQWTRHTGGGFLYHLPLVWEEFRAKNLRASDARKAGYYPLDSQPASAGTLRLEFRRFGPVPKVNAGQQVVLRLSTAASPASGTRGPLQVGHGGKLVGSAVNIRARSQVDIPLPASVLQGSARIIFDLRCGRDPVYLRTADSGAGPRLLIVAENPG